MQVGELVEPVYTGKWVIPPPLRCIRRFRITAKAFHPPTQQWCWVLTEEIAGREHLRYAGTRQGVLPDEEILVPQVLLWPCDEVCNYCP